MFTKMILATTATALVSVAVSNSALAAQKPYQATKQVACSGGFGCTLNFDPLTDPVLLKHTSCQIVGGGDSTPLVFATLNANNTGGTDSEFQPVSYLGGNSLVGEFYYTNLGSYLFGDKSSIFSFVVELPSPHSVQCTISGEYLDAKASVP